MSYLKYGYVVIERCVDPYFGPEATRFISKKELIKYLNDNKDYLENHIISILKISKDVTDDFSIYLT